MFLGVVLPRPSSWRRGSPAASPASLCAPWPRGHRLSPLSHSLSSPPSPAGTNAERLRQSTYCSRHRDRSGTPSIPVCIPAHSITSQVWVRSNLPFLLDMGRTKHLSFEDNFSQDRPQIVCHNLLPKTAQNKTKKLTQFPPALPPHQNKTQNQPTNQC